VTLKIASTVAGKTNVGESVVPLPAGGQQYVGCTVEGAVPPYINHTFQIVGVARK
jgi:hypothetical protein